MNTKDKIISFAIKSFNKEGFGKVTLQELANQTQMTRGNLTYHFKDKDILLKVIVEQMWNKMETEHNKSRQLPSFENLHNTAKLYHKIQKQYAFIFLDHHVLKHPIVKQKFREMTKQAIQDHKAALAFAIRIGNLKPEPVKGLYNHIAFLTWMISFYWLNQQVIRGEQTLEDGAKTIWSILVPHFTEKGIHSFIKFFGQEYYDNLGDAFEVDLENLISF